MEIGCLSEMIDNLSVDEPEVSGIAGDLLFRNPVQQRVKGSTAEDKEEVLLPTTAQSHDDIVALFPEQEELRNKAWWILEIAINLHRSITGRVAVTGEQRSLEPVVAVESQHFNPRVT